MEVVGAEVFAGTRDGYIYGRTKNPTQTILEERLASLESAEAALAVGSGMGAISALLWTLLTSGAHVVIDQPALPPTPCSGPAFAGFI